MIVYLMYAEKVQETGTDGAPSLTAFHADDDRQAIEKAKREYPDEPWVLYSFLCSCNFEDFLDEEFVYYHKAVSCSKKKISSVVPDSVVVRGEGKSRLKRSL
jgi:hypothetical protein